MKMILHKAKEAKRAIELPDSVVRAILIIVALVLFFTVKPNDTVNNTDDLLSKNFQPPQQINEAWP